MTVRSHSRLRHTAALVVGLAAATFFSSPTRADGADQDAAKFLSGAGNIVYLAAGTGLPLVTDGRSGKVHTLRSLDALGTSVLLSQGLKALIREKRPDSNEHDSFPSGHATAAFAVATMQSQFHPGQALLWYTGASLISASRLTLHRHTLGDVLAGAALGYGTARLELSLPRGLVLAPFIPRSQRGAGVAVGLSF